MEKEKKTFKLNSRLTFLDSSRNCCQPTIVHKCDSIIRLIDTPLRMCRGRDTQAYEIVTGTSLVNMT